MTTSHAGNEDDDYSHTADQQSSKNENNWVQFCSWKKRNSNKCYILAKNILGSILAVFGKQLTATSFTGNAKLLNFLFPSSESYLC